MSRAGGASDPPLAEPPRSEAAEQPIRRAAEIEEPTNLYFIHPLAARLVPLLAAAHVPPNAVSVAGMAFGVAAGVAYAHYQDPRWTIAGFLLMILWHVMDGADGQLARMTHKQSQSGKILDGICDYVTFIAVYAGLATALDGQYGIWAWLLIIAAGTCHAVQSAAYEAQREQYGRWAWERKSAALTGVRASRPDIVRGFPGVLYRLYARVQSAVAGGAVAFDRNLAAILEAEPWRAESIRQRFGEVFARPVRRWAILSANYRSLGIFLCALAGAPLFWFCFELLGFSAILALLLADQRRRYAAFLTGLEKTE